MTKVKTIIKNTNVERSEVLNQLNLLRGNNILDNDDNEMIETISTEVENEAFFDDFGGNTIAAFSPSMIERSLRFDDRDCECS